MTYMKLHRVCLFVGACGVAFVGLSTGARLAVVTEFTLRLYPIPPELPCITAIYPASSAVQAS